MKNNLVIFLLYFVTTVASAQHNVREQVYSHLSSHDLIVGETLYFNNYVYSEQNGRLSSLSRLLYVELIDQSGKAVYQTKLTLDGGVGAGKLYLSTDLPTGNYHFIAYTRWMKNFEAYFRQSIVVVNPYESQKFQTKNKSELKVKFAAEGGNLLANRKNKIVLRITDAYGKGIATTGKIVSKTGGFGVVINTDEFGFASFFSTPKMDDSFQMILERAQGFEFFELPKVTAQNTQLRAITTEDLYIIKVNSPEPDELSQGKILVFKQERPLIEQTMAVNTTISIEKESLPLGLLNVVFENNAGHRQERLVWNSPETDLAKVSTLGKYSTDEQVEASFQFKDSTFVSVSVEQVQQQSQSTGISLGTVFNQQLDLQLPYAFYQKATQEQLDNALILTNRQGRVAVPDEVSLLPEYRYGLIQGKVLDANGQGVSAVPVTLTFSGAWPQITTSLTKADGGFVLAYDLKYSNDDPYVALSDAYDSLTIVVEPEFYPSYNDFPPRPVIFDSLRVASIIQRSIHNQIENAYFNSEDVAEQQKLARQFDNVKSYKLADYTRFATMRDTFIELIAEVGVSKNEDKYDFKLRSKDLASSMFDEQPTLLLLDGALVAAEDAMNLSPYLVDRIDVINRRYYFGKIIFDGVISIHTLSNDRAGVEALGTKITLVKTQTSDQQKVVSKYHQQSDRTPNFQNLLYWSPCERLADGQLNLLFFTSAIKGLFEIKIEGITEGGMPVSRRAYFEVN